VPHLSRTTYCFDTVGQNSYMIFLFLEKIFLFFRGLLWSEKFA